MPLSSAALAGINAHGLHWRLSLRLGDQTSLLAAEDALKIGDCAKVRDEVVKRCRAFLKLPATERVLAADDLHALEMAIEELEGCNDDLDEVRYALNELYDKFDFYRICVG